MSAANSYGRPCEARTQLSRPLRQLAVLAAVLVLLTSSFDILLVLEAGGNYRFCQLVTVVLVLLAGMKAARGRKIPVLGAGPLLLWLSFQILFIPATDFWPKSLGYCLWLLLDVGFVFSCVQLLSDDTASLVKIVRWYAYSFLLVAAFGVVQFFLPVLGFNGLLVKQWWIPGSLARVNGFSYEPSYFATYLLIGFVFTSSLRRSGRSPVSSRMLLVTSWLTGVAIILSSSRMGITFLLADVVLTQLKPWCALFIGVIRLRIAVLRLRNLVPSFLSFALIGACLAFALAVVRRNPAIALMLLNGTGISDTAAHSVIQRENALEETFTVFLQNPLIGRSLGGVSIAIANLHGEKIHSFEASKEYEGMSVFAEALAASGAIGIIPFLWYLVTTVRKPLQLARFSSPGYAALLRALVRSLLFAWAILQFNQNILRPYLWTHIGIVASVYAAARRSTAVIGEERVRCKYSGSQAAAPEQVLHIHHSDMLAE